MSINYSDARDAYAELGIDTEVALERLAATPVSMHCWQGDDVGGFETPDATLTGSGLQATGNYPGKARSVAELRQDFEKAISLIPGKKRLNLHAIYGEFGEGKVDRDAVEYKHFSGWVEWAAKNSLGMDFNPTCFAHPLADSGFTLAHQDKNVRDFWIEHCRRCREIGLEIGQKLGNTCVTNIWIPDGYKDIPIDRRSPRERLAASLDEIFFKPLDKTYNLDCVESKLFGIGSEAYVVGSHEFYFGYAVKKQIMVCLDSGHFHPTEGLEDKISSVLQFLPRILLHVSRGVRWDSDHVVLFDDATRAIMQGIVRGNFLESTHIGLDYFDASINRIAAWVIGMRNTQKSLLFALLEPIEKLQELEASGDFSSRLALLEEYKTAPFSVIWDEFCTRQSVPLRDQWLTEVKTYENDVLAARM